MKLTLRRAQRHAAGTSWGTAGCWTGDLPHCSAALVSCMRICLPLELQGLRSNNNSLLQGACAGDDGINLKGLKQVAGLLVATQLACARVREWREALGAWSG